MHPGPVFIHPVFGVPQAGGWGEVRRRFGPAPRFQYMNPAMSQYAEYHTSLLTSFNVTVEGGISEGVPQQPVTPALGQVLGRTVALRTYGDVIELGQAANLLKPGEVAAAQIVASGPLLVPDAGGRLQQETAPHLITDGQGRFLWLINQLQHEAFTFIVGQAVAGATGGVPALAEPAKAHVWSGTQTFALAYDQTQVSLALPFAPDEPIDITVYDIRGDLLEEGLSVPYKAPLKRDLDKYSLLVVEPAR